MRPWSHTFVLFALMISACRPSSSHQGDEKTSGVKEATGKGASNLSPEIAAIIKNFPLQGKMESLQLPIQVEPRSDSAILGWLRLGSIAFLKEKPTYGGGCKGGWYAVYPKGYACKGAGLKIGPASQEQGDYATPFDNSDALPYKYYFVKDHPTPEYKYPPAKKEQEKVFIFLQRYRKLRHMHPDKPDKDKEIADAFLRGQLKDEPRPPHFVAGFLDRGFYVAALSMDANKDRLFVRTMRNTYIWLDSLEPREATPLRGAELGKEHNLPLAWLVRAAYPMKKIVKADGSIVFRDIKELPLLERYTLLDGIEREELTEVVGKRWVYRMKDGNYLYPWFVAYAEAIKRPLGLADDEPWIHINRHSQTLVLYQGKTPVFATLVSTGVDGHETPLGEFRIKSKRITATMSDIGDEIADSRYRIEDVPWTQYFSGSWAIHGAFWHDRFGIPRSHGCVNVGPADAKFLFRRTWPDIPRGWYGVLARDQNIKTTYVLVTE